jgi:hypothetical protein
MLEAVNGQAQQLLDELAGQLKVCWFSGNRNFGLPF